MKMEIDIVVGPKLNHLTTYTQNFAQHSILENLNLENLNLENLFNEQELIGFMAGPGLEGLCGIPVLPVSLVTCIYAHSIFN